MKQLTKEEALQRLNHDENILNILHKGTYDSPKYKHENQVRIPVEHKDIAVAISHELGPVAASAVTGISRETIYRHEHGVTNGDRRTNNPSAVPKQEVIERNQLKAQDVALEKVLQAVGLITEEKLVACNAVELATVVQRLSNVGPKAQVQQMRNNVNVVIHAPGRMEEADFETVEVACVEG